jgi:hypothetical protein
MLSLIALYSYGRVFVTRRTRYDRSYQCAIFNYRYQVVNSSNEDSSDSNILQITVDTRDVASGRTQQKALLPIVSVLSYYVTSGVDTQKTSLFHWLLCMG